MRCLILLTHQKVGCHQLGGISLDPVEREIHGLRGKNLVASTSAPAPVDIVIVV